MNTPTSDPERLASSQARAPRRARPSQSSTELLHFGEAWILPRPETIWAAGLAIYVVVALATPMSPVLPLDSGATASVVLFNLALLLGMLLGGIVLRRGTAAPSWTTAGLPFDATGILRLTVALALLGCAARIVDRVVLRPELLGANIDVANEGSNIVGLAASLLYPLGIACLPLAYAMGIRLGFWRSLVLHGLFFFTALDVLVVGKRGAAITLIAMYAFIVFSARRLRWRPRTVAISAGVIAVSLFAFGWVFQRRVASYGWDMCYSLFNSGYTQLTRPNGLVAQACATDGPVGTAFQFFTNFAIYYSHGLWEFSYAFPFYVAGDSWGGGGNTFGILMKPACMLLDIGCSTGTDAVRIGVYTTFWGPIFRDFGYWTAIAALVLGVLIACVHAGARRSFGFVPLYAYVVAVLLFMPVVNLIESGLGIYFMVAGVIFAAMYETLRIQNARRLR